MTPGIIATMLSYAERGPDRTALVFITAPDKVTTLSRSELARGMTEAGNSLRDAGVAAGDVVVLSLDFGTDLVATFLGAIQAGAVPCIFPSLLPRLDPNSYQERLMQTALRLRPKAIITDSRTHGPVQSGPSTVIDLARLASQVTSPGKHALGPVAASENAFIQLSGGATGHQKAVCVRDNAVSNLVRARNAALRITPRDVVVGWIPLYHDLGIVGNVLAPLLAGIPSVLVSTLYWLGRPVSLMEAVHEFGGTVCAMPNFAFNHCVNRVTDGEMKQIDLSRWRILYNSAEPIRWDSIQKFATRFSKWGFTSRACVTGYGLAENTLTVSVSPLERPPEVDWIDPRALHEIQIARPMAEADGGFAVVSCGMPLSNATVEIRSESGAVLADRHVGEIAVRSDCLFGGYFGDRELTERTLRDGWLHTGDLGYLFREQLYVCGRMKDQINVTGAKVYAEAVEQAASKVPGLRPGRVVALGVPDDTRGSERIIVLAELVDAVAHDRHVLGLEVRRRVKNEIDIAVAQVEFVPAGWIIKTTSGKLARWRNREKWLNAPVPERPSGPPSRSE